MEAVVLPFLCLLGAYCYKGKTGLDFFYFCSLDIESYGNRASHDMRKNTVY